MGNPGAPPQRKCLLLKSTNHEQTSPERTIQGKFDRVYRQLPLGVTPVRMGAPASTHKRGARGMPYRLTYPKHNLKSAPPVSQPCRLPCPSTRDSTPAIHQHQAEQSTTAWTSGGRASTINGADTPPDPNKLARSPSKMLGSAHPPLAPRDMPCIAFWHLLQLSRPVAWPS